MRASSHLAGSRGARDSGRVLLAVLSLALVALAVWLTWPKRADPPAGGIAARGAAAGELGTEVVLEPFEPRERDRPIETRPPIEVDVSPADRPPTTRDYDPWDYGVTGRVRIAGNESIDIRDGRISASNATGFGEFDRIDPSGEFQLYGLGPGAWRVVVSAPGIGLVEETATLSSLQPVQELFLELAAPERLHVDLSWNGDESRRTGIVRTLTLIGHQTPRDGFPRRSSLDACFEVEVRSQPLLQGETVPIDQWLGACQPTALSLYQGEYRVAQRELAPGERTVVWQLDESVWPPERSSLEVRVRDAVSLTPLDAYIRVLGVRSMRFQIDEARTTTLSDLPPGWCEVSVSHEGYATWRSWYYLTPGKRQQTEVLLSPGITIEGRVVGPEGATAQREVLAWRFDAELGAIDQRMHRSRRTRTGGFTFSGLLPGLYHLRTVGPDEGEGIRDLTSPFVSVTAESSLTDVEIPLRSVGRLVLDPSMSGAGAIDYKLADEQGRWLRTGVLQTGEPVHLLVARGPYRLSVLRGEELLDAWEGELGEEPVVRRF